jgi:hypothetical protein
MYLHSVPVHTDQYIRAYVRKYVRARVRTGILDVGVVCPWTQRFVDQGKGTTPGLAAEAYAAVKAAKSADQDNFIPFILETGGRVNKAVRDWLDTLTAPEPGEQVPSQDGHPWNPQTRTTAETVLREAMQALVRVQAHMRMLARIVVEIRAADIAVELEPYYILMSSMLTTPTSFPVAPACLCFKSF